ncbi:MULTISPECIES: hypothetical protein [Cyanophyceae]|nr:hypothetical protein [Phormidium sp. FACHB-592]
MRRREEVTQALLVLLRQRVLGDSVSFRSSLTSFPSDRFTF